MSSVYPTGFPCPLIQGYGEETSAGLVRTVFESGFTRSRAVHRKFPKTLTLRFVIRQAPAYGKWMNWANTHGWQWFDISIPSEKASAAGSELAATTLRFIGDLQTRLVQSARGYHWEVQVRAEER